MEIRVDVNGNPVLDQFSDEGFVDLVFRIRDLKDDGDCYRFRMTACYDEQILAIDVRIVKGIGPGFNENMELVQNNVYRDGVSFFRCGIESDRLIATIAKLYASNVHPLKMIERESYTAIALHQGQIDMESEAIKIKIFGRDSEDDSEDDYYETFFNLDLPNGFVFWNEKDQDYRDPLLRALSGSA
jgi:hypothetical protein